MELNRSTLGYVDVLLFLTHNEAFVIMFALIISGANLMKKK